MAGERLLAGVAKLDITPPLGLEMAGYGPYEKRQATEILDRLFVRALVLRSGDETLALVSADVIAVASEQWRRIGAAIESRTGMPAENLLLSASHTHSAAPVTPLIAWGECDLHYVATFEAAVVEAVAQAHSALQPARLGYGRQRVEGIGVNREQGQHGPLDTAAQLLRVDDEDGRPLALGYNVAAHPVIRYPFTSRLSADFPGLVGAALEAETGAMPFFFQGCQGNINGHHLSFYRHHPEDYQKLQDMRCGDLAQRLTAQILPALSSIETSAEITLGSKTQNLQLPLTEGEVDRWRAEIEPKLELAESRKLDDLPPLYQRLGQESEDIIAWRQARFLVDSRHAQINCANSGQTHYELPVQIMRLGEAAICVWPGEVFVELGIEVRQRSPVPLTFVVGVANGFPGYIPTPAAYESAGRPHEYGLYPRLITPQIVGIRPFRSEVGTVLVEESLRLLAG